MSGNRDYSYRKMLAIPFAEAVAKVKAALPAEGFGVLTEIDVKATLKKKLNKEYPPYTILGVCNPPFAYQALQAEKEVGLFMPCNVIVYEERGKVFVSTILPTVAMKSINNLQLAAIAEEAEKKLKAVIDKM